MEEIKANQFEDENLEECRKKTMIGKTQTILYPNCLLNFKGRMCIPRVDKFIEKLFAESHGSRYSIHLGLLRCIEI